MRYFIGLDKMTLEELEIWRLLCRHSDFETCIAGYTVNQLVVNSDSRLKLTTQKVRTILKKFEKEGFIELLTSGSKGKESTLKLTIKQQLFNNYSTNKNEQLQCVEDISNDNVTTIQQQSNNTIKEKEKEKNNNIYIDQIWSLYPKKAGKAQAYKKIPLIAKKIGEDKLIECIRNYINYVEAERESGFKTLQYMNGSTFFNGRWEDYLEKEKTPIAVGVKKNNYNSSICRKSRDIPIQNEIDLFAQ